jgi:alpha-N-arabinofuranosidase
LLYNIDINCDSFKNIIRPEIYGQFIEHLGRCINGGIYEEGSELSDNDGFRIDVLEKMKRLSPPILRWPGGTFSKIYHWMDGIGVKEERKAKKNLIWGGIEDNYFGTDEFIKYCRKINAEPFICVNMATGTPEEAANWVEYCNGDDNTYFANLRRQNGYYSPYNVKYWGLGNEEYAVCDVGRLQDPKEYARTAWEFVKMMKLTDPNIKFVIVGETTEWNRVVLEELNPICDYLSLHFYAKTDAEDYTEIFRTLDVLEKQVQDARQLIEQYDEKVEGFPMWYRFPPRQNPIQISIDEWNIWENRVSPSEQDLFGLDIPYSYCDALWVAGALNLFHRNADIVGLATLAQSVNVLGAIKASKDKSFCQTIFYPIEFYRKNCGGELLHYTYNCGEIASSKGKGSVKDLDISVSKDQNTVILMAVNRNINKGITIDVSFYGKKAEAIEHIEMNANSLDEVNTLDDDDKIYFVNHELSFNSLSTFKLNPHSINCIKFRI